MASPCTLAIMKTSHSRNQNRRTITGPAAAKYWDATLHRDRRADGSFVFAVRSTHIYCRPSCLARRPLRQNAVFFRTPTEAENVGYRPCRRCKPNELQAAVALVAKAAALLANSEEENIRLESIASQINSTPKNFAVPFAPPPAFHPANLPKPRA